MIHFIQAFQKFPEGQSALFNHHKLSNCCQGGQDHSAGNMIPHFVPWPVNYWILASKDLIHYKAVCNKVSNTFNSTTCRPAVRLRRWLLNWYSVIKRQWKKVLCCTHEHSGDLKTQHSGNRKTIKQLHRQTLKPWNLTNAQYCDLETVCMHMDAYQLYSEDKELVCNGPPSVHVLV